MAPSAPVRTSSRAQSRNARGVSEVLAFGAIELDIDRFELRRDGIPVDIEPKAFDLLVYLVRHNDHVMTRADLARDVWHQDHISEGVVNRVIGLVRKAIGESARNPKHLMTVFRRGYRFTGDVRTSAIAGESTTGLTRDSYVRELAKANDTAALGRADEHARLVRVLEETMNESTSIALASSRTDGGRSRLLRLLAQGLEWLEGEPGDHATRCRLSMRLAAMEQAAGEREAARATLARALAIADELDDADLRADVLHAIFTHASLDEEEADAEEEEEGEGEEISFPTRGPDSATQYRADVAARPSADSSRRMAFRSGG
jgi:DNA-binding winged helix-turn-helix (wHTH) protein